MRFAKMVVKYRIPILVVAIALMIPSIFGMVATRINYEPSSFLFLRNMKTITEKYKIGN